MTSYNLFDASFKNDLVGIENHLKSNNDINTTDSDGRTLIMYSAIDNKPELAALCLRYGADMNLQDNKGFTALHFAAQNWYIDVAKLILENGADTNIKDKFGNTPLWRAVFNSQGRGDLIKLLLKFGADSLLKNDNDKSPVDLANTIANYDVAQYFK